LNLQEKKTGK